MNALLRLLLSLGLLWLTAACDDTINVRLSHSSDAVMANTCALALAKMKSFYAELERPQEGENVRLWKCVNITTAPGNIDELEALLASRVIFERVPTGDSWTVWVEGFFASGCEKSGAPLLCGNEAELSIPPPDGEIWVNIQCVAPDETCRADPSACEDAHTVWVPESLETCRKP